MDLIREWAAREDVDLVAYRTDEGTSGSKTNPFERPVFREVIDVAEATKAKALVVECVDRFTRQGHKRYGWACTELEDRHGLLLLLADAPLDMQRRMGGSVVAALQAEMGKAWVERHRRAVQSGMARAKANGHRMGRPPKAFSEAEQRYILDAKAGGLGWGRIAARINEIREVHKLADLKARRRRATSATAVAREHRRLLADQNASPAKSQHAPQEEPVATNDTILGGRSDE